jgi:hypothetical protein
MDSPSFEWGSAGLAFQQWAGARADDNEDAKLTKF